MELKMTLQEADRYEVMRRVKRQEISIKRASEEIGVCYRQAKRLWNRFQREGPGGMVSKRRGRPSGNRLPDELKRKALGLVKEKYPDYGPTLAKEKLEEKHKLMLSKETLRGLMIKEGLWKAKKKKERKVYARRTRRSCIGELIQIDGSYHKWFEERADKCCLLVFVDDATSQIMFMKFCKAETTADYFDLVANYLNRYGRPKAFYSDKHSIFRVNFQDKSWKQTTFHRALEELGIKLICAHSPQAKGRVERANGVLQDRLVKALREEKINSITEGNAYLEKFTIKYNTQFGKPAASPINAHRKLLSSHRLEEILIEKRERKIGKDLSFSYENQIYQIDSKQVHRLHGRRAELHIKEGVIKRVLLNGKELKYNKWIERIDQGPKLAGPKELEISWNTRKRKPKRNHPWS